MVTLILDRKIGSSAAELYSAIPMRIKVKDLNFDLHCSSVAALFCIRNVEDLMKMLGLAEQPVTGTALNDFFKQLQTSASKYKHSDYNALIHALVETCADASANPDRYLRLRLCPQMQIDISEAHAMSNLMTHFMDSILFYGAPVQEVRVFCTRLLGVLIQTRTFTF